MSPTIISISGFSSNVGKTTLVCELLKRFGGWEAIKISRGHYRSCGKDPQACCVSPLLGERPTVFSGVVETRTPRKDTGRYWEAGASNVHWLICTSEQLEAGTREALSLVTSAGVFIEGASFLKYVPADFSLMVVDASRNEIKSSALRMANRMDAFFVNNSEPDEKISELIRNKFAERSVKLGDVPIYCAQNFEELVKRIMTIHTATKTSSLVTPLRMNM
jgi:molybdopterin-guanine dinucleotide biosynthesis protein